VSAVEIEMVGFVGVLRFRAATKVLEHGRYHDTTGADNTVCSMSIV
jgi:hypothetical protein